MLQFECTYMSWNTYPATQIIGQGPTLKCVVRPRVVVILEFYLFIRRPPWLREQSSSWLEGQWTTWLLEDIYTSCRAYELRWSELMSFTTSYNTIPAEWNYTTGLCRNHETDLHGTALASGLASVPNTLCIWGVATLVSKFRSWTAWRNTLWAEKKQLQGHW